jgi:hypothetical protein
LIKPISVHTRFSALAPRYLYYILPLTRDKPVKPAYPGELSARTVGDQKCKFGHTSLVTGVMI